MKRLRRWLAIVLVLQNSAFVLAQQPSPARAASAPVAPTIPPSSSPTWQIAQADGTVQVKPSGGGPWAAAKVGQNLATGATIHTGADGKAIVKWEGAAGVTLQSNTTLEVGALLKTGDVTRGNARALSGKALFLINKLKTQDSSFTVETPTAIVGVRGTVFAVKVSEDAASSRVAVYRGEVGVKGKGAEPGYVIVKEKMGTNIVRNKPPTPPEALAESEAAEWERMKSEIQHSTPLASVVPAIGGMIEMHQLQNAEAEKLITDANRAIKGNRKAEEDFKVFEAAIVQYYKDTGALPTKAQGLSALIEDPKVPGWHGPYLGKGSNLLDPYGRPYKWLIKKSPAGKDIYEIRSGGPDGFVGNEDDHVKLITSARLQKLVAEARNPAP